MNFFLFKNILSGYLDWNLNQMTPYHFLQGLLAQGIVLSHEKTKVFQSNEKTQGKPTNQSNLKYNDL
jgi:hypothetical protein